MGPDTKEQCTKQCGTLMVPSKCCALYLAVREACVDGLHLHDTQK